MSARNIRSVVDVDRVPATLPSSGDVRLQYGALPFRQGNQGDIEIMLVTSRRTKRWIIPKGWPIEELSPANSAAQEAFEEAGISGRISEFPIGTFTYVKQTGAGKANKLCEVIVFALEVQNQLSTWPESSQREARWFSRDEAIQAISDKGIQPLIESVRPVGH